MAQLTDSKRHSYGVYMLLLRVLAWYPMRVPLSVRERESNWKIERDGERERGIAAWIGGKESAIMNRSVSRHILHICCRITGGRAQTIVPVLRQLSGEIEFTRSHLKFHTFQEFEYFFYNIFLNICVARLSTDQMEDWTTAESALFEEAMEKYGKGEGFVFNPWCVVLGSGRLLFWSGSATLGMWIRIRKNYQQFV